MPIPETLFRVPWWGWLLIAWAVLAAVGAVLLGAVAANARFRERAARRHLHGQREEHEWRDAG